MGEGENQAVASWSEIERNVEVARVESPRCGASYYVEEERRLFIGCVSKGHQTKMRRQCEWWWAVCGGQYDWREADMVLTIQANCRPEDTWVFKAHVPPAGACDNTIVTFEACSEVAGEGGIHEGRL